MNKPIIPNQNDGFTLLELLLSLTILAVIIGIISGAFRIAVKAYEKGEQQTEHLQRQRVVLELIKRQLSSLQTGRIKKPVFKGGRDSVEFVSLMPLNPNSRYGAVQVKYLVKSTDENNQRLLFYEKNTGTPESLSPLRTSPDEKEFHELIPAAYRISFEYLKRNASLNPLLPKDRTGETRSGQNVKEGGQWQETWDSQKEGRIPKAVRISFQKDEHSDTVYVIARMNYETVSDK